MSDYAEIQRALERCHALADAAEAHGTLSGALCAAQMYQLDDWLGEILPEGRPVAESADCLREVYEATSTALIERQMGFAPLLPADDDGLAVRTSALGEWCRGFLYGLGSGPARDLQALGADADEILRDLTAITQVDVDPEDSDESNEEAYAELVEFVRVGVQLIFERLQPLRRPPPADLRALH